MTRGAISLLPPSLPPRGRSQLQVTPWQYDLFAAARAMSDQGEPQRLFSEARTKEARHREGADEDKG